MTPPRLPDGPGEGYLEFVEQVAMAQFTAWLPERPCRLLDLSGPDSPYAPVAARAGHDVVLVAREPPPGPAAEPGGGAAGADFGVGRRLHRLRADHRYLDWLADATVDAVVAEGGRLSEALALERTAEHLARVLRPGGRALLTLDSLLDGLAALAEQSRWAELADVPAADVVLVPDARGRIRRCVAADEVVGLLRSAGLVVDWVRPRTVLSARTVERALREDADALATLVGTELRLSAERAGEPAGRLLLVSAQRPLAG